MQKNRISEFLGEEKLSTTKKDGEGRDESRHEVRNPEFDNAMSNMAEQFKKNSNMELKYVFVIGLTKDGQVAIAQEGFTSMKDLPHPMAMAAVSRCFDDHCKAIAFASFRESMGKGE